MPGTTIDEDRAAMRNARRERMLKLYDRILIALCDIDEAAWADIAAADYPKLTDADCDAAEARAAQVEAAMRVLTNPPPAITEAQRREHAADCLGNAVAAGGLSTKGVPCPIYGRAWGQYVATHRAVAALLLHGLPEVQP